MRSSAASPDLPDRSSRWPIGLLKNTRRAGSHIAAHARISQYNPCRFASKRNSELLVTISASGSSGRNITTSLDKECADQYGLQSMSVHAPSERGIKWISRMHLSAKPGSPRSRSFLRHRLERRDLEAVGGLAGGGAGRRRPGVEVIFAQIRMVSAAETKEENHRSSLSLQRMLPAWRLFLATGR